MVCGIKKLEYCKDKHTAAALILRVKTDLLYLLVYCLLVMCSCWKYSSTVFHYSTFKKNLAIEEKVSNEWNIIFKTRKYMLQRFIWIKCSLSPVQQVRQHIGNSISEACEKDFRKCVSSLFFQWECSIAWNNWIVAAGKACSCGQKLESKWRGLYIQSSVHWNKPSQFVVPELHVPRYQLIHKLLFSCKSFWFMTLFQSS